ncbi:MAG TPA: DNA repair protein RecO [Thiobacillus sp.]|nr:MAG: DNA repair protein RecO [Hydrogenophilales bacterium 28-61-11]OYZ58797.1 MAG: DNA repair protein RecO [Hydrogenophilales bacterium 16-61-112]OZA43564.1 MAG: DNA repair protein RecO [Hydrogenophilales bacterium 17-61-76]HQT30122.1 DNA repair protein RecO [Thiobacillus sp.]HQT69307.1 DNA repair protein RecO [Thiobacillus sp.]
MSTDARINNEPGFILHTYSFKETSVVAEVFTRSHGRVALIARGARRPTSVLRGLMQPFTPLLLSWFGKSDLKTLHAAEWHGGIVPPQGRALMCGFYLNELLLRLLARGDAHETLYAHYVGTLAQLAAEAETPDFERILRRFEKQLLGEIGYGATFDIDADSGAPIQADRRYVFQPERGALRASGQPGCPVSGQTLLDLAADSFERPLTLSESKSLMRMLINHTLGAKPLYTRQLLRELTELNPSA